MKVWLAAALASAALAFSVPGDAHMGGAGGMGGGRGVGFGHATGGFRGHGFAFHTRLPRDFNRFHSPHFRFGGFRLHQLGLTTGGSADYDYASDEDDYGPGGDDIDNLHFRAQEPFGPGDIGRPPGRAEADAPYMSDRMDARHGYEPQDR